MSHGGMSNARLQLGFAGLFVVLAATFFATGCGVGSIGDARALGVCARDCSGQECGSDGCGGICGVCAEGELCNGLGTCYEPDNCTPDCLDRECGDDGCGSSCGVCAGGELCDDLGTCYEAPDCVPDCLGTDCGPDGCGGQCGTCAEGELCNGLGTCYEPNSCIPDCVDRECGSDGCDGTCGTCSGGDLCDDWGTCVAPPVQCIPNCSGKECGGDGCGGSCGRCSGGESCNSGTCVAPPVECIPDCSGKECGGDGCGGSCGTCASSDVCQSNTCTTPGAVTVFFKDKIQTANEPWGFDEALTEYPVGSFLSAGARSDAKANLTKVADPAGGGGYAIRQAVHANGPGGGRSELGVWTLGGLHGALRSHLRTGAPIFISMEMYLPVHTQPKVPDDIPWLAMYDIHPDDGGVWRPGWSALWPEDGSDRLLVGRKDNGNEKYSSVEMPIGEWFTFEIEWSGGPSQTVRTWINGQLATTQNNVRTTPNGGLIQEFETYIKVYTEPQGQPWVADPVIKYVRNYQITDAPRFH